MPKKVERNPDRPFEDMNGKWIGLGYRGSKPNPKKRDWKYEYNNTEIETGEIEKLEKLCRDGNSEACDELEKLLKDNDDFLEHLMAIADYDEYPPKLKDPSEKE